MWRRRPRRRGWLLRGSGSHSAHTSALKQCLLVDVGWVALIARCYVTLQILPCFS